MKRINRIAPLLLAAFLLTACAGGEQEPPTTTAGQVVKLIMDQSPDQGAYVEGETFDPAGTVINAQLSDGSILEDVPYTVTVDTPLTRTTLYAEFAYGGKTVSIQLRITLAGNGPEYTCENTPFVPGSPLEGKVIYFLGSSVTLGAYSGNESMADYLAKKDGAVCIKEAVSGTTLGDFKDGSYVERLNAYLASPDRAEKLDAFVVQLSTNDRKNPNRYGTVTAPEVRDPAAFDLTTSFGAMEYIIATVRDQWNCPIFFYINPPLDEDYARLVEGLEEIAEKWEIGLIDLYHDEAFNALTPEEYDLYMADEIHPTKAGYRDWWLPKFEEALEGI